MSQVIDSYYATPYDVLSKVRVAVPSTYVVHNSNNLFLDYQCRK